VTASAFVSGTLVVCAPPELGGLRPAPALTEDKELNLKQYGWNAPFVRAFAEWTDGGFRAARVLAVWKNGCRVIAESGELDVSFPGRLVETAVGDWLVLAPAADRVEAVLPRKTVLARKQPGSTFGRQVLAANIDVLLIVAGVDGDFNVRRIERYLILAQQSGADPVIVLSKADVLDATGDHQRVLDAARSASPGTPVVFWSAWDPAAPAALTDAVGVGNTAALIGSSGVGKSTMVNVLLGSDALRTQPVREGDSRGRHTTTHRELFLLPQGWLLIDMPGMREVQLWASEQSVETVFDDLRKIAAQCRFRDCAHQGEPDCAVAQAIAEGRIGADRVSHFRQLRGEVANRELRQSITTQLARKRRDKILHRSQKQMQRHGPKWRE
jgi:ribosome biogenesis GTPase